MESRGFFSLHRKLQPLVTLMRYEDRGDNHACVHNLTGMPEGQQINIRITPKNWAYPSGVTGQQMVFQDVTTTLYRPHPDRPARGIVQITGGLIASPR